MEPRAISRRRRVAFLPVLVGFFLLLAEVCSFFLHWARDGHPFSYSRIQEERRSRVDDATPFVVPGADRDNAYPFLFEEVIHPYLGYVCNPEINANCTNLGFIDDQETIRRRSADEVLVGILGGSFAQMWSFEGFPTLEQELSRSRHFAGKRIVPVRAALGGFKEPQQLMTLSYLLALGAEFDLVIDIDGFNEVALHPAENAPHGVFAAFPRAWFARLADVPDPEFRAAQAEVTHLRTERVEAARFFSKTLLRSSVTANLVWRLRDDWLGRALNEQQIAIQNYHPKERPYVANGPAREYASEAEMYEDLVSIWKRCSIQLDRLCRANGIRYFQFLQPNQYVPGSKRLDDEEREKAYNALHPYRDGVENGYPLLVREGADLVADGVSFTDLTMIFADVKRRIYADSCCHVNHEGYEIIARAIAGEILRSYGP